MARISASKRSALLAVPVLAALISGCGPGGSSSGSNTSTTAVTATTSAASHNALTVYVSDPPAVRSNPSLQAAVTGEQLAFNALKPSNKVTLKLETGAKISDNARTAIADNSAIAYLGEFQSGQSRLTAGITNAQDLLELSATDTTKPGKNDYEAQSQYGDTFASVPAQLGVSASALQKANPALKHQRAQAAYGYAAMEVLLKVLLAAHGQANNRATIVHGVQATLKDNKGHAAVSSFKIKLK
ncbi:MAG: hypothetical protein J2O48_07480 [Solirubrobacterales bacterium]|nr:hypothetical protein [Solirubrobacterales bacterium]